MQSVMTTSTCDSTIRALGRTLPVIASVLISAVFAFASERFPEAPVFPPVDPSLRQPPPASSAPPHSLKIEEHAPAGTLVMLEVPAHIAFVDGLEVISEVANDRLSFRPLGSAAEWMTSPLSLDGPHAVDFAPSQGLFYCVDTDNHRVITFDRIDVDDPVAVSSIAGVALDRPHDVLVDPATGLVYVLNPNAPVVFRFSELGVGEAALDLSIEAGGYSRGLTLVDGTIYLAASAHGRVIEIRDFDAGDVTVHPSYGKIAAAAAGSWETTGFIPNDVEFYDGYWYLSNFFHPSYASGTDHNRFKLVRFRTWDNLATGQWEELSHLLPDAQVPYFFSVQEGSLYLATFSGSTGRDVVFEITSGLFFDDFESGDLSAWAPRTR
jgi:hypothetical protein